MLRPSFTFVTGLSFIVGGLSIGKANYILRIGNNGITISNVLLTFGFIVVIYNAMLILVNRNKGK
jgi:hypothetical protein